MSKNYKGKHIVSGEWFFGDLIKCHEKSVCGGVTFISHGFNPESSTGRDFKEVDPKTVCRYSGLKDKNGKPIFEGDQYNNGCSVFTIVFYKGAFCACSKYDDIEHGATPLSWTEWNADIECDDFHKDIEIIGNIHDKQKEQ